MKIQVLAFATASDLLGAERSEIEIADGSTVASLKRELESRHPELGELWHRLAVAINGEIAPDQETIPEGAEIAILPPVSGG